MQNALTKAGTATKAYLYMAFHRDISHWQRLCKYSLAWPRSLEKLVHRLLNALGFYYVSGMVAGESGLILMGQEGGGFPECKVARRHCLRFGNQRKPYWWHHQLRF